MFDKMKDMANPDRIQEVLSQVDFPAGKQEIVGKAQQQGVNDTIVSALERIPDRVYETPQEVVDEVRNRVGF